MKREPILSVTQSNGDWFLPSFSEGKTLNKYALGGTKERGGRTKEGAKSSPYLDLGIEGWRTKKWKNGQKEGEILVEFGRGFTSKKSKEQARKLISITKN